MSDKKPTISGKITLRAPSGYQSKIDLPANAKIELGPKSSLTTELLAWHCTTDGVQATKEWVDAIFNRLTKLEQETEATNE